MQTLKPSTVRTLVWLAILPYLAGGAIFLTSSIRAPQAEAPVVTAPTDFNNGTIGEIRMFGGNFAPRGWALCDGQLLAISQNQALFSILGTTYGGDGRTTFGLPDMRGRIPMHPGNGPGLTSRRLGEKTGWESVTLNLSQMPSHTHQGSVSLNVAKGELLEGQRFDPNARSGLYYQPEMRNIRLGQEALAVNLSPAGGNQPFQILQPSNCVNFIICLQGTYPSRS